MVEASFLETLWDADSSDCIRLVGQKAGCVKQQWAQLVLTAVSIRIDSAGWLRQRWQLLILGSVQRTLNWLRAKYFLPHCHTFLIFSCLTQDSAVWESHKIIGNCHDFPCWSYELPTSTRQGSHRLRLISRTLEGCENPLK